MLMCASSPNSWGPKCQWRTCTEKFQYGNDFWEAIPKHLGYAEHVMAQHTKIGI